MDEEDYSEESDPYDDWPEEADPDDEPLPGGEEE
jgi:hypothetical protein